MNANQASQTADTSTGKRVPSMEEEAFVSILKTAEMLTWAGSDLMKRFDLTPTQYNVLRILRGAEPEGASCTEVSERLIKKDSDITRLLDRLESRGLISRSRES